MPQIKSKQFETFNDGLLTLCEADERTLKKTKIEGIRFGNRTVGVQRYWQAKTAGSKVDRLVAVPLALTGVTVIETRDIVILTGERLKKGEGQYQILQVQFKQDAEPPALYLSLSKLVHPYKDRRGSDGFRS